MCIFHFFIRKPQFPMPIVSFVSTSTQPPPPSASAAGGQTFHRQAQGSAQGGRAESCASVGEAMGSSGRCRGKHRYAGDC